MPVIKDAYFLFLVNSKSFSEIFTISGITIGIYIFAFKRIENFKPVLQPINDYLNHQQDALREIKTSTDDDSDDDASL